MTKIYTVEEIVDLGNHVLNVTKSRDSAERLFAFYENKRILRVEESYAAVGQTVEAWQYLTKHEICEYELED